jgi:hypothetical protein
LWWRLHGIDGLCCWWTEIMWLNNSNIRPFYLLFCIYRHKIIYIYFIVISLKKLPISKIIYSVLGVVFYFALLWSLYAIPLTVFLASSWGHVNRLGRSYVTQGDRKIRDLSYEVLSLQTDYPILPILCPYRT